VRWENQAVTVEGLLHIVKEGKEACNWWLDAVCRSSHVASADGDDTTHCAMVVEISPRAWAKHPTWATNTPFKPVIKAKTKVRMTGLVDLRPGAQ
jgi:hypothetical protein